MVTKVKKILSITLCIVKVAELQKISMYLQSLYQIVKIIPPNSCSAPPRNASLCSDDLPTGDMRFTGLSGCIEITTPACIIRRLSSMPCRDIFTTVCSFHSLVFACSCSLCWTISRACQWFCGECRD